MEVQRTQSIGLLLSTLEDAVDTIRAVVEIAGAHTEGGSKAPNKVKPIPKPHLDAVKIFLRAGTKLSLCTKVAGAPLADVVQKALGERHESSDVGWTLRILEGLETMEEARQGYEEGVRHTQLQATRKLELPAGESCTSPAKSGVKTAGGMRAGGDTLNANRTIKLHQIGGGHDLMR